MLLFGEVDCGLCASEKGVYQVGGGLGLAGIGDEEAHFKEGGEGGVHFVEGENGLRFGEGGVRLVEEGEGGTCCLEVGGCHFAVGRRGFRWRLFGLLGDDVLQLGREAGGGWGCWRESGRQELEGWGLADEVQAGVLFSRGEDKGE